MSGSSSDQAQPNRARAVVAHGHRPAQKRRTGFAVAKWLALGIAVPTLSFFVTVYAPSISHALQIPAQQLEKHVVALPSMSSRVVSLVTPNPVGPLPEGSANLVNPDAPLTVETFDHGSVPLTVVAGGTPGTRRSMVREGVGDFVKQAGATAGLNGTFFANASLSGTDNLLIGPSMSSMDAHLLSSPFDTKPQLTGRPMVLLSERRTVIVPFELGVTDKEDNLRSYLPEIKDAFLGGVWLVHNGIAANSAGVASFNVKDAMDPRRRAFFAVMPDGRPVLGATTYVGTSLQLASALQKAGVQEAVLLDSGFSTSLVFQDKILVTGHTAPGIPSRPVPQAIVLYGSPTAETAKLVSNMTPSVAQGLAPDVVATRTRRRHHHTLS